MPMRRVQDTKATLLEDIHTTTAPLRWKLEVSGDEDHKIESKGGIMKHEKSRSMLRISDLWDSYSHDMVVVGYASLPLIKQC